MSLSSQEEFSAASILYSMASDGHNQTVDPESLAVPMGNALRCPRESSDIQVADADCFISDRNSELRRQGDSEEKGHHGFKGQM
jgi:hypothetical protein